MAEQGKCKSCKTRITWKGERPLKRVVCPTCFNRLKQTSSNLTWPVIEFKTIKRRKPTLATWRLGMADSIYVPSEQAQDGVPHGNTQV